MKMLFILLSVEPNWGFIIFCAFIITIVIVNLYPMFKETEESCKNPQLICENEAGTFFEVKEIQNEKILLRSGSMRDGPGDYHEKWFLKTNIPQELQNIGFWFRVINTETGLSMVRETNLVWEGFN